MADPKKLALLKRLGSLTSQSSQLSIKQKSETKSKRGRFRKSERLVPFNKKKDRRKSIYDAAPDVPGKSKLVSKRTPNKTLRKAIKSGVELTATQKKILALEKKVLNNLKSKYIPASKSRLSKRVTKKISKKDADRASFASSMIKSAEQNEFVKNILEKSVFFEGMSEKFLAKVVNAMYLEEVQEDEIIINEGDNGSKFYILYMGELARETNSWDNAFDAEDTLTPGSTFGDRGLLYDSPNEFTIVATEPSVVFILDRKVYKDLLAKMESNDRSQILNSLKRVPVLQGLSDETLDELVDFIEEVTYHKGDQVIKKGETGTELYILKSGVVKCTNIGETDGVMNDLFLYQNDYFGEAALIKNQPRAADIFCESDVAILYKIDREIFEKVFGPLKELLEKNWQIRILKTIPIFSEIDDEGILEGLLEISEEEVITEKGKKVVTKGKKLSHFYIILEGKVCIYAHKRMLPKGQAESDTESVFGMEGVEKVAKKKTASSDIEQVRTRAIRKKDKIVKDIGQIVDTLKGVTIEDDKGEPLPEFTDENGVAYELVTVVESGNYIGESCLLGELPLADVITKTAVKLLKFDVVKVNSILSNPTKKQDNSGTDAGSVQVVESDSELGRGSQKIKRTKRKKKSSGSKKYSNLVKAKIEEKFEERRRNTMIAEKANISFHDLKQFQTLGTGTFGRVRLVQDKNSKYFYALKIISKKKVVEYGQKKNVYNEKRAMLESDHPFILKLFTTFKDETNIYMLLELVQGGELFSLMRELKKKTDAKFYTACVLLGLEYLHNKRIIYRDIKPENILLDKQGYVKIVDFGFAKRVKSRTYTMCGTPEYMAPEIFLRKGYNRAVDFWALGICFFEMCFGYTPFADERGNDHIQVCKNIVRNRLKYPEMNPKVLSRLPKEKRAKRERRYFARRRLVKALLRKDPRTRAGMKKHGVDQIKREEIFDSIDWELLEAKKFPAPWRPRIKDEKDCSHFMKYPENERAESYTDDGTGWDEDF